LLTGGTKGHRYALPNATVHMHQPLGGAQGQASDIEIQANEMIRLKKRINEILADNTGQPLDKIEDDTNRDIFMNAEESVEYGLVDHVLEPPDGTNSKKK
jgi:ATP-dependent Clp protease protease subunit